MKLYRSKRQHLFKDWSDRDFEWFCLLVFRFGKLTIGAPTSPAISNVLCFDLDVLLDGIAQSRGANYTRYADDLFFSTNEPKVLAHVENDVKASIATLSSPQQPSN